MYVYNFQNVPIGKTKQKIKLWNVFIELAKGRNEYKHVYTRHNTIDIGCP